MSGRFAIDTGVEKIREQFKINSINRLLKNYNVVPTERAVCLIHTLLVTPKITLFPLQYLQNEDKQQVKVYDLLGQLH